MEKDLDWKRNSEEIAFLNKVKISEAERGDVPTK